MSRPEGPPSDNLYIQGLPHDFSTESVKQFFGACGDILQAKSCGRGYALVRFSSLDEAAKVKEAMHGQQPTGCTEVLTVTYANNTKDGSADWNCPKCDDKQFGKNSSCRSCGCPRPTGDADRDAEAQEAAEQKGWGKGPRGDPSRGDWDCQNCGDMQFARNSACRVCGCPKEGGREWTAKFGKGGYKTGGREGPYGVKGSKGVGKMPGTAASLVEGLIHEGLPGGGWSRDDNALYVANLPLDTRDRDLYTIFGCFGAIPPRGVKVMPSTGGRTWAFVNFMNNENAEFAMSALNGVTMPDGCKLIVKNKQGKEGKGEFNLVNKRKRPSMPDFSIVPPGVDAAMWQHLQTYYETNGVPAGAMDVTSWYVMEHLGHIEDPEEMKGICDVLLDACSHLGLS